VKIAGVVTGRRTGSVVRICLHFARCFCRLAGPGGVKFLVLYLKACHVLVMQASAGMKIPAAQSLGVAVSRTNGGIPRIVPSLMRAKIRAGDRLTIRLTLTILSLYRVLEFPGKLKLSTITDPGKDWAWLVPEARAAVRVFWSIRP
jgi:hypothetical protein